MARQARWRVILAAAANDLHTVGEWLGREPHDQQRELLENALEMIANRLRLVRHALETSGPSDARVENGARF